MEYQHFVMSNNIVRMYNTFCKKIIMFCSKASTAGLQGCTRKSFQINELLYCSEKFSSILIIVTF